MEVTNWTDAEAECFLAGMKEVATLRGTRAIAPIAEEMLETPLEASCIRLLAHMVAAKVYLSAGREDDARRQLDRADEVNAVLPEGDHRSLPTQFLAQGFYHELLGREQEALDFFRTVAESDNMMALKRSICALYRQGEFVKAEATYEHLSDWVGGDEVEVAHAFLIAELQGTEAALEIFKRLAARAETSASPPYYPTVRYSEILRLLGKRNAAQDFLVSLRSKITTQPMDPEWDAAELRYLCGELSATEFLAETGPSPARQMIAHYDIGMDELARGHRSAAVTHFQLARGAGMPPHHEWYWASAFLRRLESEPNWPLWIPTEETAE